MILIHEPTPTTSPSESDEGMWCRESKIQIVHQDLRARHRFKFIHFPMNYLICSYELTRADIISFFLTRPSRLLKKDARWEKNEGAIIITTNIRQNDRAKLVHSYSSFKYFLGAHHCQAWCYHMYAMENTRGKFIIKQRFELHNWKDFINCQGY